MVSYYIAYVLWKTQTPPLRYVSETLWIILSGWVLFLLYVIATVPLILTGIGILFIPKLLQIAVFSFNPIGSEIILNPTPTRWYHDPNNILVKIFNVIFFIFIGWEFFLLHIIMAIVQAITIFGIGNAITHFKIAKQTIAPFGKHVQKRLHPVRPVRNNGIRNQQQLQMRPMGSMGSFV